MIPMTIAMMIHFDSEMRRKNDFGGSADGSADRADAAAWLIEDSRED
jgi:hypothetical protein